MYGLFGTVLLLTDEEIDDMWWDRAEDRLSYWRDFPPAHLLLRLLAQVHAGFKVETPADDEPPPPGAL